MFVNLLSLWQKCLAKIKEAMLILAHGFKGFSPWFMGSIALALRWAFSTKKKKKNPVGQGIPTGKWDPESACWYHSNNSLAIQSSPCLNATVESLLKTGDTHCVLWRSLGSGQHEAWGSAWSWVRSPMSKLLLTTCWKRNDLSRHRISLHKVWCWEVPLCYLSAFQSSGSVSGRLMYFSVITHSPGVVEAGPKLTHLETWLLYRWHRAFLAIESFVTWLYLFSPHERFKKHFRAQSI